MRSEIRRSSIAFALYALLLATAAHAEPPVTEGPVATDVDGSALFNQLKDLVGEWQGQWEPGSIPTTVTYSLTGNGSVLVEDYVVGETTMATLYHLDGNDLMLTHYCSAGNQPRMRASSVNESRRIEFDFIDITNHASGGYSKKLVVSMLDDDRISLSYTGSRTGRSSGVELERVR